MPTKAQLVLVVTVMAVVVLAVLPAPLVEMLPQTPVAELVTTRQAQTKAVVQVAAGVCLSGTDTAK